MTAERKPTGLTTVQGRYRSEAARPVGPLERPGHLTRRERGNQRSYRNADLAYALGWIGRRVIRGRHNVIRRKGPIGQSLAPEPRQRARLFYAAHDCAPFRPGPYERGTVETADGSAVST